MWLYKKDFQPLTAPEQQLVEEHLPLARRMSLRYWRYAQRKNIPHYSLEDFAQEAVFGLMAAARYYDSTKEGPVFAAFAFLLIRNHLSNAYQKISSRERPRSGNAYNTSIPKESLLSLDIAGASVKAPQERQPDVIAERHDTDSAVRRAIEHAVRTIASVSTQRLHCYGRGCGRCRKCLNARLHHVARRRLLDKALQTDVARELGVTHQRVSQIEARLREQVALVMKSELALG
jgi:DNA-directed RNA polymerase specialized sigma subunit